MELAVKEGKLEERAEELQTATQAYEERKRKLEEREEEVQKTALLNEEKKQKMKETERQFAVKEKILYNELDKERKSRMLCEKENAGLIEEIESTKAENGELKKLLLKSGISLDKLHFF